ncbi:MFS transporter [Corynebacterium sp.]|uniref:MFS transporter n=1 Tax=Corynebacterium sp. TaxID=1720 RepID=UPI002A919BC0|nr:MFS transporter [Corynebacterium sp.]MDY5785264.1 MFS transporter [Corynebacterium sp.]
MTSATTSYSAAAGKVGVDKRSRRAPMSAVELVAAYSALVVTLLQTLVVPVTPLFPEILGISAATASWIVTSTLLIGTIATPVVSRLADMYGRRRLMLIALGLVLAGSVIAAAGSTAMLIVGRGLQGVGTAIIPVAMALVRDLVPPQRLPSALALLSAMLGIGGGLGIPIGGAIMGAAGWRAIFAVAALLSLIALVAVLFVVPRDARTTDGPTPRFDLRGAIVLGLGLTCLLIALTRVGEWGWTNPLTVGLIAASAVVFTGWVALQRRTAEPLVDVHTAALRPVFMANLAGLMLGFAMFANLLVTTIQLQNEPAENGFAISPGIAGMAMLPSALMSLIAAPVAARIANKYSPRFLLQLGAAIIIAGYLLRWVFSTTAPMVVVWATVLTIGISFGYAALPMIIVAHVEPAVTAGANGFNTLLRSIGMSLGSSFVATMGVMFAGAHGGAAWEANVAVFLAGAAAALVALIAATAAARRS